MIEVIADPVEASDLPHKVMEGDRQVGQISRKAVIDVLVGRR